MVEDPLARWSICDSAALQTDVGQGRPIKAFLVQRNLGNKHQGAVLLHGLDDLDLLFEELVDEVGEFDTFVRGFLR